MYAQVLELLKTNCHAMPCMQRGSNIIKFNADAVPVRQRCFLPLAWRSGFPNDIVAWFPKFHLTEPQWFPRAILAPSTASARRGPGFSCFSCFLNSFSGVAWFYFTIFPLMPDMIHHFTSFNHVSIISLSYKSYQIVWNLDPIFPATRLTALTDWHGCNVWGLLAPLSVGNCFWEQLVAASLLSWWEVNQNILQTSLVISWIG